MPEIGDATGIEFGWSYGKPEGGLLRDLCDGLCGRRQTLTAESPAAWLKLRNREVRVRAGYGL
jgi:hypothetical protein